jgi:VWFA-related protein
MRLLVGLLAVAAVFGQDSPLQPPPPNTGTIIRTETKQVLVDAVVTDKKGNYVRDLAQKDFKVAEDNKEQNIKSFSYEADPASPLANEKRYLVLLFDNSTMDFADQKRARDAATKFIETNVKANRPLAIANFTGSLQIAQNFTDDVERLKQVVAGVKFAYVSPNAGPSLGGGGRGIGSVSEFGQRSMLLALRTLARNMSDVPGRKILVLFSNGFPLTLETRSELTAAIDACNKANVAVYPIDVRGLISMPTFNPMGNPRQMNLWMPAGGPFGLPAGLGGMVNSFQARGGGSAGGTSGGGGSAGGGGSRGGAGAPGGGGGAAPGGSSPGGGFGGGGARGGGTPANPGGNTGGRTGPGGVTSGGGRGNTGGGGGGNMNPNMNPNMRMGMPQSIIPMSFPPTVTTNQEVLYALADGTGGFVIVNTNDLLGGLEKIVKEQNEYYLIGYTPPESAEGTCHQLKVKVTHGYSVRARSGYCNVKSVDLLAGKPQEQDLETKAAANVPGDIPATMLTPFFYTGVNTARVNVTMDIPTDKLKIEKVKGKLHLTINVLGLAHSTSGAVAARFSDAVEKDFADKKEAEAFQSHPYHYENQFDIASGNYKLTVVFSAGGESFGKIEQEFGVDPYDAKGLFISAAALSRDAHPVSDADTDLDSQLLEGRAPLVVTTGQGRRIQITPTGSSRFKKTDNALVYVEVYVPSLAELSAAPAVNPTDPAQGDAAKPAAPKLPDLGMQIRVLDRKTNEQKFDSGMILMTQMEKAGTSVVPAAFKLPVTELAPGAYKAEFKVMDATGRAVTRPVLFEVE